MAKRSIFQSYATFLSEGVMDHLEDLLTLSFTTGNHLLRLVERPRNTETRPPLGFAQTRIPRTHGDPISLANSRHRNDFEVEIQILDHALNDHTLLEVFLTKEGKMGLDDIEELGNHRRHATEMPRTKCPAEWLADFVNFDRSLKVLRIHLRRSGIEQYIRANFF